MKLHAYVFLVKASEDVTVIRYVAWSVIEVVSHRCNGGCGWRRELERGRDNNFPLHKTPVARRRIMFQPSSVAVVER